MLDDLEFTRGKLQQAQQTISELRQIVTDANDKAAVAKTLEEEARRRANIADEKYRAAEVLKQATYAEVIKETFERPKDELVETISSESTKSIRSTKFWAALSIGVSALISAVISIHSQRESTNTARQFEKDFEKLQTVILGRTEVALNEFRLKTEHSLNSLRTDFQRGQQKLHHSVEITKDELSRREQYEQKIRRMTAYIDAERKLFNGLQAVTDIALFYRTI